MPNRVKKIEPTTVKVTITKQPEKEIPRPVRRNLKSANRVITVDKKLIQKEQLLIPKAAPDLQVD